MDFQYSRPAIPKINITKKVKTLLELDIVLGQIQEGFSQYLAELAGSFMQNYIIEKVYDENALGGGSPESTYVRTYHLSRAVTVTQNKKGEWRVGIDGRKIRVIPSTNHGEWGQHAGVYGEPVASQMASYLEFGNQSPLYEYEGIGYMEATQQYINSVVHTEWDKFKRLNGI